MKKGFLYGILIITAIFMTLPFFMMFLISLSGNENIFTDYKNSLAMKNIKRGESVSGILSFSVDNPKREHWLVFYDKRTRKPLAKISINNAMKDLKITDLEKQKKKRRKKDKMVF